ncbi:MAG: hypothetical protein M3Y18_07330 [Candidatus Eremiobacteraeota bacterium]|nr:hypothetical protein [Candidatus Eremiobacteraeota bacterium]
MRVSSFPIVLFALAVAGVACAPPIVASAAPLRHAVYHFDVSVHSDLTVHTSGIDGGSATGSTDYGGGDADRGTIAIDVLSAAADGGLNVQIREDALYTRTAKPALCAVYGDGRVVCDPEARVNAEEHALLLAFGRGFVDAAKLDAENHWTQSDTGSGFATLTDYTIASGDLGKVVTIALQRVDKMSGAQGYNAVTSGTIAYNVPMSIPTAIKENTTMRQTRGIGQDNRIDTSVTLSLVSDSMQGTH